MALHPIRTYIPAVRRIVGLRRSAEALKDIPHRRSNLETVTKKHQKHSLPDSNVLSKHYYEAQLRPNLVYPMIRNPGLFFD